MFALCVVFRDVLCACWEVLCVLSVRVCGCFLCALWGLLECVSFGALRVVCSGCVVLCVLLC